MQTNCQLHTVRRYVLYIRAACVLKINRRIRKHVVKRDSVRFGLNKLNGSALNFYDFYCIQTRGGGAQLILFTPLGPSLRAKLDPLFLKRPGLIADSVRLKRYPMGRKSALNARATFQLQSTPSKCLPIDSDVSTTSIWNTCTIYSLQNKRFSIK